MNLYQSLESLLPADRLKTRAIDLYARAGDASFYYLIPKAVVLPVSVEEIQSLFKIAKAHGTHLTFRAAGTSISGQSVTDGILVDLSRHWGGCRVEQNGELVRVYPGIIGAAVNQQLKKWGRKIGPDPASINAAMMGGILSNNSSGMCCGVVDNSYHTLVSVRFALPDGSVFDTGIPGDYERFEKESSEIFNGIVEMRDRILLNAALTARIRSKYLTKNTVGYSLNAFVDYEHPLDILGHLLIGGEGTLAFIVEAVMRTLPDLPAKKTGLLFFDNPMSACNAILPLKESGAAALEFMDRASLRTIENIKGVPDFLKSLPVKGCAILCEYQALSSELLEGLFERALAAIENLPLIAPAGFTDDPTTQALYWKIRKGMYPSVAAVRAKGTAVLQEDVAFPVSRLGEAIEDMQDLLAKFGYDKEGIIFGHAKDGNLHFVLPQAINTAAEIDVFRQFNEDLVALVVGKYDGSLKAEHGTGRQIAPFIEAEWGGEAYEIMKELKTLIDPFRILNQGVIINADKECHLKNLKQLPVIEEEVDKCVECGYCERRCPSREYTMTPRQRIGVRRALVTLKAQGKTELYNEILGDYQHDGMDTCAVDGMCATDCPVNINTGELIKRLRRENHSDRENNMALRVAKGFKAVEGATRFSLQAGFAMNSLFGSKTMPNITAGLRIFAGGFPQWQPYLTRPPELRTQEPVGAEVVYFASCISRMMGSDSKGGDIMEVFLRVARKSKVKVLLPHDIKGSCCGQIFSSKGYAEAYRFTANETIESLWGWTNEGKLPVVMDVTSCTNTLQHSRSELTVDNQARFDKLIFMDSIDFALDVLLPRLAITKKKDKIVFHPVCSLYKMEGLLDKLKALGKACANRADIPIDAGCCGMAGDRGFYFPELIAAATKAEATEVKEQAYDGYYSSAKTCEASLSAATGKNYRSVLWLLDEVS